MDGGAVEEAAVDGGEVDGDDVEDVVGATVVESITDVDAAVVDGAVLDAVPPPPQPTNAPIAPADNINTFVAPLMKTKLPAPPAGRSQRNQKRSFR